VGIIFLFVAGFIVFIMAIFSLIKMAGNRVTAPTNELKEEIATLKNRVNELEDNKN